MVELNVFPWREAKKQYEQKVCKHMALALLIVLGLQYVAVHEIIHYQLDNQAQAIETVQQQLAQYVAMQQALRGDEQEAVWQRLNGVIRGYQAKTMQWFFTTAHVPLQHVCVSALRRDKDRVQITGFAASAADLADFLVAWGKTLAVTSLNTVHVEQQNDAAPWLFRLVAIEASYPF